MLIDTHAHIHSEDYPLDSSKALKNAEAAGVNQIICVGTSVSDSQVAISFARDNPQCLAAIGLHPHQAREEYTELKELVDAPGVVAVGECGLDYFYEHSPRERQKAAFRFQLELAQAHGLPLIFHVRDQKSSDGTPTAFDDFFEIIDNYQDIRGVVHSFTSGKANLEKVIERGLYIGLNGIMTFTRDKGQLTAARAVPLTSLLLETDAPFLAPVPQRGKPNEPANLKFVAEFLAELRGEAVAELATATTQNAQKLFKL